MIKNIWKAAFLCLAFASCENDVDKLLCYDTHDKIENDITLAGAVGDGQTDCSEVINKMISELPEEGGVIIIPEGDFVLDSPIVLSKSNVVLKGLNSGFISNIDVKDTTLVGPGGGSKLIVRNAESAITVADEGLSGIEIRDLMISGGTENNGVGILFEKAVSGAVIDNVVGINLLTGVEIHKATNLTISNCWICELSNSIVLTGGEIAAMAVTDAVCRMVPGVLADPECFEDESHFNGLLEYPQYSRPAVWHGREVPAILTSGNHEKVRQWRRKQSLRRTRERRPDMYEKLDLSSKQDKKLLKEMEVEDLERIGDLEKMG